MNHIAILKKGPLDMILNGSKTIESRWSLKKIVPFKKVNVGDVVYMKKTGGLVVARFRVNKVEYFEYLSIKKILEIYTKYGSQIGMIEDSVKKLYNKKYCSLFWISELERVVPFDIYKDGYGIMSAWICVDDIEKIKKINTQQSSGF